MTSNALTGCPLQPSRDQRPCRARSDWPAYPSTPDAFQLMLRPSYYENHMPTTCDGAGSTSGARHPARLAILSLLWMGCLCAIVIATLVWPSSRLRQTYCPPGRSTQGSRSWRWRFLLTAGAWPPGEMMVPLSSGRWARAWTVCFLIVHKVRFAPWHFRDGTTLATGHSNFTCVLWDPATGKDRTALMGHTGSVICLDFSPDGAILATGSADSTIRLWDVASGQSKATLCGHRGPVCSIRFAPDGQILASQSQSRTGEALGNTQR